MAWPRNAHVLLPEAQLLAGRDADLRLHQVHPRDRLGHRMLHLDAGVHLHEVEVLLLVQEELDGARVGVADRLCGPARPSHRASPASRASMMGQGLSSMSFWWRRWIEQSRSTEVDDVAVLVAEDLHLDVLGVLDVLLEIDAAVAEGLLRLGLGSDECGGEGHAVWAMRMPRPPPPAAALMMTG